MQWKSGSPVLAATGFVSNSIRPLMGSSTGHCSGGRGPAFFFPASTRFFQTTLPDETRTDKYVVLRLAVATQTLLRGAAGAGAQRCLKLPNNVTVLDLKTLISDDAAHATAPSTAVCWDCFSAGAAVC